MTGALPQTHGFLAQVLRSGSSQDSLHWGPLSKFLSYKLIESRIGFLLLKAWLKNEAEEGEQHRLSSNHESGLCLSTHQTCHFLIIILSVREELLLSIYRLKTELKKMELATLLQNLLFSITLSYLVLKIVLLQIEKLI